VGVCTVAADPCIAPPRLHLRIECTGHRIRKDAAHRSATVWHKMFAVVADIGTIQPPTSRTVVPKPWLDFLTTTGGEAGDGESIPSIRVVDIRREAAGCRTSRSCRAA
jgi:hypothetical protein